MKKFIFLLVFLLSCYSNAQIINFPDPVFKAVLLQSNTTNLIAGGVKIDANDDGEIEVSEVFPVYQLQILSGNITDITGIEYFINLYYCVIRSNQIAHANLSNSPNLQTLTVNNNQLQSLNVSGLNQLYFINCLEDRSKSLISLKKTTQRHLHWQIFLLKWGKVHFCG